eukprot:scaffold859_cov306-Pinguiococcus_pyrenoidosus.AAC.7
MNKVLRRRVGRLRSPLAGEVRLLCLRPVEDGGPAGSQNVIALVPVKHLSCLLRERPRDDDLAVLEQIRFIRPARQTTPRGDRALRRVRSTSCSQARDREGLQRLEQPN